MSKKAQYGNDSIKSLKGADRVRQKPAVIFGDIFGGILRRAKTQAVKPESKLISAAFILVVFPSRIKLAEQKRPVITMLYIVIIDRHAAPEVPYLD